MPIVSGKYIPDAISKEKTRIINNYRIRIKYALEGREKFYSTKELLGCGHREFLEHLESEFIDGMSWENYGVNGWHIDHIEPCCSFDLASPEEQLKCFNYKNTQPIWGKDNLKKIVEDKKKRYKC